MIPTIPRRPTTGRYRFRRSIDYAGTVMTQMMIATKNDPQLENLKWTQESGTSVVTEPNDPPQNPAPASPQVLGTVELQEDAWRPAIASSDFQYGMKSELTLVSSVNQQVQVDISNNYMRYLGIYISFFDADGNVLDLSNVTIGGKANQTWWPCDSSFNLVSSTLGSDLGLESNTMRYVDLVGPINIVLGIPIPPDGQTSIYFEFPEEATKAVIYGCGLGGGDNSFPTANIIGGVMTGLINITIPAFLMGFAVAGQSYTPLYKAMQSKKVLVPLITLGIAYFGEQFTTSAVHKKMNWDAFTSLTTILFQQACSKALQWCEEEMAEGEIEDEIPFSGWIMVAINIAAGLAQEAETIVEVATSPWHIDNAITTTINSQVVVHPDPQHDGAWPEGPAGATYSCAVKMYYKGENAARSYQDSDLYRGRTPTGCQSYF